MANSLSKLGIGSNESGNGRLGVVGWRLWVSTKKRKRLGARAIKSCSKGGGHKGRSEYAEKERLPCQNLS